MAIHESFPKALSSCDGTVKISEDKDNLIWQLHHQQTYGLILGCKIEEREDKNFLCDGTKQSTELFSEKNFST